MASFPIRKASETDVNMHCEGFEEQLQTTSTVRQAPSQRLQLTGADNATSQISTGQYCSPSSFPAQQVTSGLIMPFPQSYVSVNTTPYFPQSALLGSHHILPNTTTQFCQPHIQPIHNQSPSNTTTQFCQPHIQPLHNQSPSNTTTQFCQTHIQPIHNQSSSYTTTQFCQPHIQPIHNQSPSNTTTQFCQPHIQPLHNQSPSNTTTQFCQPHNQPLHNQSSSNTTTQFCQPHIQPLHHQSPSNTTTQFCQPHIQPLHNQSSSNTTTQFCQPHIQPIHNLSPSNMPYIQSAFAPVNYFQAGRPLAQSSSVSTPSNVCPYVTTQYNPPPNILTYFEQPKSISCQNTTPYPNQQTHTPSDLTQSGFLYPNPPSYSTIPFSTPYVTQCVPFQPAAIGQYSPNMTHFPPQQSIQSANMRPPFNGAVNTEQFPLPSKIPVPEPHPSCDSRTRYFQHSGIVQQQSVVPNLSEQQQHLSQSHTAESLNSQLCSNQYSKPPSGPMHSPMPASSNQCCMGHYPPLLNTPQEKIHHQQPHDPFQSSHEELPPNCVPDPPDFTSTRSSPSNLSVDIPHRDVTLSQECRPLQEGRSLPDGDIPRPCYSLPFIGIPTSPDTRTPLSERNIHSDLASVLYPPGPVRHDTMSNGRRQSLSSSLSDRDRLSSLHPSVYVPPPSPQNPFRHYSTEFFPSILPERIPRPDTPRYDFDEDPYGYDYHNTDSEDDSESDSESPFALLMRFGLHARRRGPSRRRDDHNGGLSDDEALAEGIAASLNQGETIRSEDSRAQISALGRRALDNHLSECLLYHTRRINVNRDDIWGCSLAFFKDITVSEKDKELRVQFEDADGKREEGVDDGGPRREYLQLLLEAIVHDSGMLHGDRNQGLLIRPNISLHCKQHFRVLGIMLATIIAQCGRPPAIFAPPVVDAILDVDSVPSLKYIPSSEIRKSLQMVCDAATAEQLAEALAYCEWRYDLDIPAHVTLNNKDEFVAMCFHYYVILSSRPMLDQMVDGLRHCGILKLIRTHKLRYLLEYDPNATLTAKMLMNLLVPRRVLRNLKEKTQVITSNIQQFLTAIETGSLCDELLRCYSLNQVQISFVRTLTLEKVLTFVTGCSQEPVGGFSPAPSIVFRESGIWKLPHVSTCSNELHIHVHEEAMEPSSLAMALVTSLMNSKTFTST